MDCEAKTRLAILRELHLHGVRVDGELLRNASSGQVLGEGRLDIANQLGVEVVHGLALVSEGEYLRSLGSLVEVVKASNAKYLAEPLGHDLLPGGLGVDVIGVLVERSLGQLVLDGIHHLGPGGVLVDLDDPIAIVGLKFDYGNHSLCGRRAIPALALHSKTIVENLYCRQIARLRVIVECLLGGKSAIGVAIDDDVMPLLHCRSPCLL